MMTHTPGSWTFEGSYIVADGIRLAEVGIGISTSREADVANGVLMAAAPDLLAACKAALAELANECAGSDGIYKMLTAAIAKAEGGA